MRNFFSSAAILAFISTSLFTFSDSYVSAQATTPQAQQPSSQQTTPTPAQTAPPPTTQPAVGQLPLTPQQTPPPTVPPVVHAGPTIILNPAHGGTDPGARGQNGIIEKDLVLQYARMIRSQLERQGFRVVLTRDGDANPSYDDRAAVSNAYRDAIFISLHVASTGTAGTARVYYYRFGTSPAPSPTADATPEKPAPLIHLASWDEAQMPHIEASQRLAAALQIQLAQRFNGSPAVAVPVAVRELRSVDAPAVAIELSSVSASDSGALVAMALPLSTSISNALQAFRNAASSGGH